MKRFISELDNKVEKNGSKELEDKDAERHYSKGGPKGILVWESGVSASLYFIELVQVVQQHNKQAFRDDVTQKSDRYDNNIVFIS